jgi:hypothetical protein
MTSATAGQTTAAFVDIPAKPTLVKTTGLPPIRVWLPLEGRMQTNPFWFVLYSLLGLIGPIMLLASGFFIAGGQSDVLASVMGLLVLLPFLALSMITLTYYCDLIRPRPVRLIDERSLWDSRSLERPLLWTDVAKAKALRGREYHSVHLHLRRSSAARRKARSLATAWHLVRRRDRELFVSLGFLKDPRVLALAMLELVKRHGGVVEAE